MDMTAARILASLGRPISKTWQLYLRWIAGCIMRPSACRSQAIFWSAACPGQQGRAGPLIRRAPVDRRVDPVPERVRLLAGERPVQVAQHDPDEQVVLPGARAEPAAGLLGQCGAGGALHDLHRLDTRGAGTEGITYPGTEVLRQGISG